MQRRHLLTAAAALPLLACQRPTPELPGGFADTDTLAHGHALRDQLAHMRQCGFDAFAVRADKSLTDALKGLAGLSVLYGRSAIEPRPLFRRGRSS